MPVYQTFKHTVVLLLLVAIFSSCGEEKKTFTTLKASLDFANTNETGSSSIKYNSKTGENIVIYQEIDCPCGIFGMKRENEIISVKQSTPYFGFGVGLEYITKGAKYQQGNTIGLNYIEIPIHLLYNYPLNYGHLYAGFGPYFAYGIGGQIKGAGFSQSSFGETNGGYKRFDAGLGLMLGCKLPAGISLDFSYDFGLANIAYPSLDVQSHNRCFSINIGYDLSLLFHN